MKDDLQKSDSCGLKSERKKILTSSTCSLACLSSNLGAFCPMVVHLPSEKSILPYFSGPRGVAISVPFPEVRSWKGTESGLLHGIQMWNVLQLAINWNPRVGWELYLPVWRCCQTQSWYGPMKAFVTCFVKSQEFLTSSHGSLAVLWCLLVHLSSVR